MLLALTDLVAWAVDARWLYAPPPTHQAMVPVTAVLLALLALAVAARPGRLALGLAAPVLVLSAWSLAAHHGPLGFPPGRLLFYERVVGSQGWRASLPAVPTSVLLLLLAAAVVLAAGDRWTRTALALAGVALVVDGVFLFGQVATVERLYGSGGPRLHRGVSLWAALGILVLTSAFVGTRLPDRLRALVYGSGNYASTFRFAAVASLAAPVVIWAAMAAWGHEVFRSPDDRVAVTAVIDALVVAGLAAALLLRLQGAERHRLELLHEVAHTDELTGLANRRAFFLRGEELLSDPSPGVGVIVLDVDGLKRVNDELGHQAGDLLLQAAAQRLRAAIRDSDVAARLGGDEFAVVAAVRDDAQLTELADRVEEHLSGPVSGLPAAVRLRASVGAAYDESGDPTRLSALLHEADERMYAAKSSRSGDAAIPAPRDHARRGRAGAADGSRRAAPGSSPGSV